MTTSRALLLLAAAVLIPACHDDDDDFDQDLLIHNQGAQPILVRVDHEDSSGDDDVDIVEVAGGASVFLEYDGDVDVDVLITRKSDGLILYAASFDPDDFDDADGTIQIFVTP